MFSDRDWKRAPIRHHALVAAVITLGLATSLWGLIGARTAIAALLAWLAAVNAVVLGYYFFDKQRAQTGGRRVPEAVLHGLAVAGGGLGAYGGMRLFRHKTMKGPFRVVFWLTVAVQVVLIAWAVKLLRGE